MPKTTAKASPKPSSPAPEAGPHPVIEVRDFGPIANGIIEQRPLTVFAGPSNTGKSWMATLIYVIGRYRQYLTVPDHSPSSEDRPLVVEDPQAWRDLIRHGESPRLTPHESAAWCYIAKKSAEVMVPEELRRCYGVGKLSALVRNGSKSSLRISFSVGKFMHFLDGVSESGDGPLSFSKIKSLRVALPTIAEVAIPGDRHEEACSLLDSLSLVQQQASLENRADFQQKISGLGKIILLGLGVKHRRDAVYYLPADRGGVMHSHSVVVKALIQSAFHAGLRHQGPMPVLSGILGDFLMELVDMAKFSGPWFEQLFQSTPETGMSQLLEERILRGKVTKNAAPWGYPTFGFQPEGWKENEELPLMTTSSMVAELAPVVLFLRERVHPGDTLILEEPEAHLHPAAQMRFVAEIAGWVKAGIKVVLTTHSEWILDGLSSIVTRGELQKQPEHPSVCLDKGDVGVWVFDHIDPGDLGKGAAVVESPWDMDQGGYQSVFYDAAVDSHNDLADAITRWNEERPE